MITSEENTTRKDAWREKISLVDKFWTYSSVFYSQKHFKFK